MAKKVSAGNVPGVIGFDRSTQRKYEIEDALRTMTRAEEIKKDASLMRDVKKLAREQQTMLGKVSAGGGASNNRPSRPKTK